MSNLLYYVFITIVASVVYFTSDEKQPTQIIQTVTGYLLLATLPWFRYLFAGVFKKYSNLYLKIFLLNIGIFALNFGFFNICHFGSIKFIVLLFVFITIADVLFWIFSIIFKFDINKMNFHAPLVIVLLTAVLMGVIFHQYLNNKLEGNINNHILSSTAFGVPQELQNRGIKPFFLFDYELGWDGQFYYYIANDLFANKDTPVHIDAPAYRYYRAGFAFFSKIISLVCLQDWVSPQMHLLIYCLLFLIASYTLAKFLQRKKQNVWLSLVWIFTTGNMLTIYNALPDAAADSFFILSLPFLYSFMNNKKLLFNGIFFDIFITFAIFSREVYSLFLFAIFIFVLIDFIKKRHLQIGLSAISIIPIVIYIGWRMFITLKLGSPLVEAIVGLPFVSLIKYLFLLLYPHQVLLPLYAAILLISVFIGIKVVKLHQNLFDGFLGLSLVFIVILYSVFGDTIIINWTGYWKAIGPLIIISILLVDYIDKKFYPFMICIVIMMLVSGHSVYFTHYSRLIEPKEYQVLSNSNLFREALPADYKACFDKQDYKIKIIDYNIETKANNRWLVVKFIIQNKTDYTWKSGDSLYNINISGFWLNKHNNKTYAGYKTFIPDGLAPNAEKQLYVVAKLPQKYKHMRFVISPVQIGCDKFYQNNTYDNVYIDLNEKKEKLNEAR